MLNNFSSTIVFLSACQSRLPRPHLHLNALHLSFAYRYFSAPENDFAHLKMNYPGFPHPRSRRKVPYFVVWHLTWKIRRVMGMRKLTDATQSQTINNLIIVKANK